MNVATQEPIALHESIALIARSAGSILDKAQSISDESAEIQKVKPKGLSRITYGLFITGITFAIATNVLMVFMNASLAQLAFANFSTMILVVLGSISLLNDLVRRNPRPDGQPVELKHRLNSISENVEQLSHVTFEWNRKLQHYEDLMREKINQIEHLEEMASAVKETVEMRESDLIQVRSEYDSLNSEKEKLLSQIATLNWDAESVRSKKETYETEIEESRTQLETSLADLSACEVNIAGRQKELEWLDSVHSEVATRMAQLEQNISGLQSTSDSLEEKIYEQKEVLENKEALTAQAVSEKATLELSIVENTKRLEDLFAIEASLIDLKSIQDSIDACTAQMEALEAAKAGLDRDIAGLESNKSSLVSATESVQTANHEQNRLFEELSGTVTLLKGEESQLANRIDIAQSELNEIIKRKEIYIDITECSRIISEKRDEFARLCEEESRLRMQLHGLGKEASDIDAILYEYRQQLEEFETQSAAKLVYCESLNTKESQLNELVNAAEQQLGCLEGETEHSKKTLSDLQIAISDAKVQVEKVLIEIERKSTQSNLLDDELDRKIDDLNNVEESIRTLNERAQTLNELCKDAEFRISVLAEKSEVMASHITTSAESLESLQKQRAEIAMEIEHKQAEILEKSLQHDILKQSLVVLSDQHEILQSDHAALVEKNLLTLHDCEQASKRILELESVKEELIPILEERDRLKDEVSDLQDKNEFLALQRSEIESECNRVNAAIKLGRTRLEENEISLRNSTNELLQSELKLGRANEAHSVLQAESQILTSLIATEQRNVEALKGLISDLENTKEDLQSEVHAIGEERQSQLEEHANYKLHLRSLEEEIKAYHETISKLRNDIAAGEQLEENLLEARKELESLSDAANSATEKLTLLERNCHTQEDQLSNLQAEAKQIAATILKREKSLVELNQSIEATKASLADMEARRSTARKELDYLEQTTTKSQQAAATIAAEISGLELKRQQIRVELDGCAAEVSEAQSVCKQWQDYTEKLRRSNEELEISIKSLEKQLDASKMEYKKSEYALEQNQISVKNAAITRDKLLSEIAALENSRRDLIHSEDALNHSLESKRSILKEIVAELDRGRMNVDNATLEFEQTRLRCKTEKGLLSELISQHDELLREISNRSELHEQQIRRCDDLKSQESSLQLKLSHLKDKVNSLQEQENVFNEKRVQWEEVTTALSRKSIELEAIQSAIATHREQMQSVMKELTDLQNELVGKEKLLTDVADKLSHSKLRYTQEMHEQKITLADLAEQVTAKGIILQNIENAIYQGNEKCVQINADLGNSTLRIADAQKEIDRMETDYLLLCDAKKLSECEMVQLREEFKQLEAHRVHLLQDIADCEEQKRQSMAEKDQSLRSQMEVQAMEQELKDHCAALNTQIQDKQSQLLESERELSASEQQIIETLQAITLMGQQREHAQKRLKSDLEALDTARKGVEALEIHKLDCESILSSISAEVSRMITNRELLDSEIRELTQRRRESLREVEESRVGLAVNSDLSEVLPETNEQNMNRNLSSIDDAISEIQETLEGLAALSPLEIEPADDQNSPRGVEAFIDSNTRIDYSEGLPKLSPKHNNPIDVWGDLLREVRVA